MDIDLIVGAGHSMAFSIPRLDVESEDMIHLDFLRILASVGIVCFHYRHSIFGPGDNPILSNFNLFVDLFFVISGFVMLIVYENRVRNFIDYFNFMIRRIARLAPLHWVLLLCYIFIGLHIGNSINSAIAGKFDIDCIVPNILFYHSANVCNNVSFNLVSWSISAEMFCYILFPIFLLMYKKNIYIIFILSIALFAILYATGPSGPLDRPWYEWTFDYGVLRALPAFTLGIAFAGIRPFLGKIPFPATIMFGLLGVFVAASAVGAPKGLLPPIMYAIAAAGIAADYQGRPPRFVRNIAPAGRLTYSIYMLHLIIHTILVTAICSNFLKLEGLALSASAVVAAILVFPASYISFFLFETPARKLISKLVIVRRPKPGAPAPTRAN